MVDRLTRGIGSGWFFWTILVLFIVYSTVLAATLSYPMAFDESYHFALIEYYSHQFSPIIHNQPAELAVVGDATRMTSYLFHYLMSYPLRFVTIFTQDLQAQIVSLRVMNIAMVVAALITFRSFIMNFFHSKFAANISILMYCILPVTAYLSANINYDNALLLFLAVSLFLAQKIYMNIHTNKRIKSSWLAALLITITAGALIKFTFAPVAVSFIFTMAIYGLKSYKHGRLFFSFDKPKTTILLVPLLIISGMAMERFGGNIVQYKTPLPDCSMVQPVEVCSQYGPWARNYNLKNAAVTDSGFDGGTLPGYIIATWLPITVTGLGMMANQEGITFTPGITQIAAKLVLSIVLAGGVVAIFAHRKNPLFMALAAAFTMYLMFLALRNYSEYLNYHQPVAIQGRYILMLIIPFAAIIVRSVEIMVPRCIFTLKRIIKIRTPQQGYQTGFELSLKLLNR